MKRAPEKTSILTETEFAALQARGVTIHHDRACLKVEWEPIPGLPEMDPAFAPKERRFIMTGPSGRHSLLVEATDLERLNAHWTTFCSDARNRRT